jgi:hypothetical protein
MKTLFKYLSAMLAISLTLTVLLACGGSDSSNETVANEPEIAVHATQLLADYKANEVAADERYKGKVIQVTGYVDSIGKDILDSMYVTLKAGGRYEFASVQCFFPKKDKDQLSQLRKGQAVTITGRCQGKMMNVLLKGCVLAH